MQAAAPYTYQSTDSTLVPGANNANWTFAPNANGNYQIYVIRIQIVGNHYIQHSRPKRLLSLSYAKCRSTDLLRKPKANLYSDRFKSQNPLLESSISLTITGPGGYGFSDFQPINVSANGVSDYTFTWTVPDVAGIYVVETNLAPTQLTAYDAKYLKVSASIGFAASQGNVVSKGMVSAISVFVGSQASFSVYSLPIVFRKT